MVYLQHRVSPHSYSRDRRWDRLCRQSAHFCLQAPLPQTRPVIMGLSPPDHAPHNTRCRPPSSRRCGPGRSGRPPGQLPPRRLVCIMAATARGPLDAESTQTPSSCSGGGGRGAIQRFHPDRWIVVPAAQLAQCCVRWWGPQYRRRPRGPGHDQASNMSPARRRPTHAAPIARSAGPMTTPRDPSPGVQLAVAPLHHRLQRCQAHCR